MIEVWISGRARRAVVDDGEAVRVLCYGTPDTLEPCSPRVLDVLRDVEPVECRVLSVAPDPRQLHDDLAREVAAVRVRGGLETLLDPAYSRALRRTALEETEALLEDAAVARAATAFLYSAPLPFLADTDGALALCAEAHAARAQALVAGYCADGVILRAVWEAWDELSQQLDASVDARRWFATHGGFAALVAETRQPARHEFGSWIVAHATAAPRELSPAALKLKQLQQLVTARLSRYDWGTGPVRAQQVAEAETAYEVATPRPSQARTFESFTSVQAQLKGIVSALQRGKEAQADRFVDDLCAYQRQTGDVTYLAKSLCNLAQQAAAIGRDDYAERLLQRAVSEAPLDAWTWQQLSTAYRRRGKFQEAELAAERALQLDSNVVARYDDALAAYDDVIKVFPNDVVARNGRAYVLLLMQRVREALASLPSGRPLTAQDWVAFHVRGMAHLRAGSLGDAQRIFEDGADTCPTFEQRRAFRSALAVTLIRQKRYEDAASQIEVPGAWNTLFLQASASLFAVHAWGAAGHKERAAKRFEAVARCEAPLVHKLRDALGERYGLTQQPRSWLTPPADLDRIIEEEEFRLLTVA